MTVSDLALSMERAVRDAEASGHALANWRVSAPGKEATTRCTVKDCVLVVRIKDSYGHSHHWFVACPFTKEYQDSLRY